jgi:phage baseplate assembly protein W
MDRSFLGTGWNFPPTFRREWYGVEMLSNEEDVKSSIYIILSTITGERIMLPTFGCNLMPELFKPMNASNVALMEKFVREALVFHEPRIIVEELITTVNAEMGRLDIDVGYTIISTNTRTNYVFPYYISEATNLVDETV